MSTTRNKSCVLKIGALLLAVVITTASVMTGCSKAVQTNNSDSGSQSASGTTVNKEQIINTDKTNIKTGDIKSTASGKDTKYDIKLTLAKDYDVTVLAPDGKAIKTAKLNKGDNSLSFSAASTKSDNEKKQSVALKFKSSDNNLNYVIINQNAKAKYSAKQQYTGKWINTSYSEAIYKELKNFQFRKEEVGENYYFNLSFECTKEGIVSFYSNPDALDLSSFIQFRKGYNNFSFVVKKSDLEKVSQYVLKFVYNGTASKNDSMTFYDTSNVVVTVSSKDNDQKYDSQITLPYITPIKVVITKENAKTQFDVTCKSQKDCRIAYYCYANNKQLAYNSTGILKAGDNKYSFSIDSATLNKSDGLAIMLSCNGIDMNLSDYISFRFNKNVEVKNVALNQIKGNKVKYEEQSKDNTVNIRSLTKIEVGDKIQLVFSVQSVEARDVYFQDYTKGSNNNSTNIYGSATAKAGELSSICFTVSKADYNKANAFLIYMYDSKQDDSGYERISFK